MLLWTAVDRAWTLDDSGIRVKVDGEDQLARYSDSTPPIAPLLRAATAGSLDAARARITEARFELNIAMMQRVASRRALWMRTVQNLLLHATLLGLLLPLVVWRGGHFRLERLPHTLLSTALLMLLVAALVDGAFVSQTTQQAIASFGSPSVAVSDALLHYLVVSDDAELLALVDLLGRARSADAWTAAGLLGPLLEGARAATESQVFAAVQSIVRAAGTVVDLAGPLLGLLVIPLVVRFAAPIVRDVVRYPAAEDPPTPGRFLWLQLRVLVREMAVVLWMLVALALTTCAAVVVVRVVTYPITVAEARAVLAATAQVSAGGSVPDLTLVAGAVSAGVALAGLAAGVLGAAGVGLTQLYLVSRSWMQGTRGFPVFRENLRGLVLHVFGRTVVAAGASVAVYATVDALWPATRVWSPMLLGLVFAVSAWALRVHRRLWTIAWRDPVQGTQATPTEASSRR